LFVEKRNPTSSFSFMDAILNAIGKRQAARALLAPEPTPAVDAATLKAMEEARLAQEAHVKEIMAYRERVGNHMRRLIQTEELRFMQYPPCDVEHRYQVAKEAENCGLVSHEFGEEGIDRFIIVYKPEFEPDDDELARMALKYTRKMDESMIERALNPEDDEEEKPKKKPKPKKTDDEDEQKVVLHAVGLTKRVRRGTADAIEEIRRQKSKKKSDEIDSLFVEEN